MIAVSQLPEVMDVLEQLTIHTVEDLVRPRVALLMILGLEYQ
jgi:hypothetical protein